MVLMVDKAVSEKKILESGPNFFLIPRFISTYTLNVFQKNFNMKVSIKIIPYNTCRIKEH